jgi:CDP-glucose 4,6-dehydratase
VQNPLLGLRNSDGPILLTGHTGFKGTWLTFLLEELEIPVIGFSLPPLEQSLYQRANRLQKIPEVFGDVRDLDLLKKTFKEFRPTCVIHMAAQPLVIESYKDPLLTFDINVLGSANVLEVATTADSVRTIACITTDKVYHNNNENQKFLEGDMLRGKDPYSASKVAMESVIDTWRNLSNGRNKANLLSFRSGNVIGGGDYSNNRLMPDIIRNVFSGQPLLIRNPDATRPWQHVLDPLLGYISGIEYSISESNPVFDTFNFGPSENSLSVREVIQIAKDYYPKFEVPELNEFFQKSYEATSLQLDSSRANSVLGWKPKMTQKQAVISTISWWIDNLEKGIPAEVLCKNEIKKFFRG